MYFVGGIVVALVISFVTPGAIAGEPLRFGVLPRFRVVETVEYFQPLADYLSGKLGREVQLIPGKDYPSFWQSIANREYDLVLMNQYQYVKANKEVGYRVIAKNEEGGATSMFGAIIVRKDSGIQSLRDLAGKKILFGGDSHAMIAYIAPTYLLKQAGLAAGKDYESEFAKNPSVAVVAVAQRFANAAGAGDLALRAESVSKHTDPNELHALVRSEPIAQLPWAVKRDLDKAVVTSVRNLLLELHATEEGRAVLKSAKLTAIRAAEDTDYALSRKIIKDVLEEEY